LVAATWSVILDGFPGPCSAVANINEGCMAAESSAILDPARLNKSVFVNLVRTVPRGAGGRPAGAMTLSGFVTVTTLAPGTNLDSVSTVISTCAGDTAPRSCAAPSGSLKLTSHTLATPIPVVPDQIVQVKVTISFS
jgi:hypothetical protein